VPNLPGLIAAQKFPMPVIKCLRCLDSFSYLILLAKPVIMCLMVLSYSYSDSYMYVMPVTVRPVLRAARLAGRP